MKINPSTCLCLLVASIVDIWACSASSKTKSSKQPVSSQLNSLGIYEPPAVGALKGTGGGLDVLEAEANNKAEPLYRPWKTRFDLQPYDLNNPDFLKSENRMSYRRFYEANPNLALQPNSRDRQAQSTVEMMFGLTALGTVVGGILIVNGMQVLDADNLDFDSYQRLMIRVIAFAAVPWLLLGGWLLFIFAGGVANPMRDPRELYHWQCSAMAWFLLVAPAINTAYFTVHALWVSRLFFNIDKQVAAPMGRMFSPSSEMQKLANSDLLTHMLNVMTGSVPRHTLLFLEVLCVVFGYMLISFRWGANSQFCQPEVYWATTAVVVTIAIISVVSALAFVSSIFISVYSASPWVQDFAGSFREARLLSKMARDEARDAAEGKANKNFVEESADEFQAYQQEFEEERQRYQENMEQTAKYEEALGQLTPPPETQLLPSAAAVMEQLAQDDEPLLIWGDDDEEALPQVAALGPRPDSYRRPQSGPIILQSREAALQEPKHYMGSIDPSMMTASFNGAMGSGFARPLSDERVFISGQQPPISASLAAVIAQVEAEPKQRWPSQGFAMPFGVRPSSAPVLTATGPFAIGGGDVQTVFTPQNVSSPAGFTSV